MERLVHFPVPDDRETVREQQERLLAAAKDIVPCFESLPQYDMESADGRIMAGFLHTFGAGLCEKTQKLFCYIGVPARASEEKKVPAMLLIHGGTGQAFSQWVEEWMRRGYGAITVDLYGNMPLENGDYIYDPAEPEEKRTCRSTPTGMCGGGFDLAHPGERITDQGMFHVIAANILAGNLLRSLPFVEETRIGVTGISWGGLTTAILIGFDQRFAFAIPVYGSAFLNKCGSCFYFYDWYQDSACAELWGAEKRLKNFRQPILWVNGANDDYFPAKSTSLSFLYSADALICLKYDLPHGHKFDIGEVYAFADQVLEKRTILPAFRQVAAAKLGRKFTLRVSLLPGVEARAALYYLDQPMSYHREGTVTKMDQAYRYAVGAAVIENGLVRVEVPQEAHAYFIELWCGQVMTSTPLVELETEACVSP